MSIRNLLLLLESNHLSLARVHLSQATAVSCPDTQTDTQTHTHRQKHNLLVAVSPSVESLCLYIAVRLDTVCFCTLVSFIS